MDFSHGFTVTSKRSTFVIFLIVASVSGLMTLGLAYSLLRGSGSLDSLITGFVFLLILTAIFLWGADSSFRVLTCQNGVFTEIRGRFFKKRITTFDLRTTERMQALFVSVRGIRHAYLQFFGQNRTIILGPLYYTRRGRLHILEAIRPLLQDPTITKEGDLDRVFKEYYNKYHPRFDKIANVIHVDQLPPEA